MSTITCTKVFHNLPFAHRQHNHDGHCRLIHGHNWAFELTFAAKRLDENMFVVDFGKLKWVREWLEDHFDHTLVLNADDPCLGFLKAHLTPNVFPVGTTTKEAASQQLAKIVVVPNCGAEGLAVYVLKHVNDLLVQNNIGQDRGLVVASVRAYEDEKNSATARLFPHE